MTYIVFQVCFSGADKLRDGVFAEQWSQIFSDARVGIGCNGRQSFSGDFDCQFPVVGARADRLEGHGTDWWRNARISRGLRS